MLDLEFGIQSVLVHVFFCFQIFSDTDEHHCNDPKQKDPRAWAEYRHIVENHMDRIILNQETINRSSQKDSFHIACKTLKFVK